MENWKNMWNLRPIFPLVNYDCSYEIYIAWRDDHVRRVIYVDCSFREQSAVNIACMELSNRFLSLIESRTLGFRRRRYGRLSLATAELRLHNFIHFRKHRPMHDRGRPKRTRRPMWRERKNWM